MLFMVSDLVDDKVFTAVGRLCAYYAYLEGAVASAIQERLGITSGPQHPVTNRLQLRDSFKLLIDLYRDGDDTGIVDRLKGLNKRLEALMERRNVVVHGTINFVSGSADMRWLMNRGDFRSAPQPVTVEYVTPLIAECEALWREIRAILSLPGHTAHGAILLELPPESTTSSL
jgi:hypothetical protein